MTTTPSFTDLHDPGDVLIYVCLALVVCILFLALTCACGWLIRQCCRFLGDEEPLDCSWQDHGDAVFVDEFEDNEAPFVLPHKPAPQLPQERTASPASVQSEA